jgi:hypothetical protein
LGLGICDSKFNFIKPTSNTASSGQLSGSAANSFDSDFKSDFVQNNKRSKDIQHTQACDGE